MFSANIARELSKVIAYDEKDIKEEMQEIEDAIYKAIKRGNTSIKSRYIHEENRKELKSLGYTVQSMYTGYGGVARYIGTTISW